MRVALLTAGLIVAFVSTAAPVTAQFRGELTSRPPVIVRAPARPIGPLSVWWPASLIVWPAHEQFVPPFAEGAPAGGVQLDVQPWSADVYVDGTRAGRVEQFRGYYQHLELPAGPHTIAIVAPGYEPLIAGVMVIPGRTITYRATLQR